MAMPLISSRTHGLGGPRASVMRLFINASALRILDSLAVLISQAVAAPGIVPAHHS